MKLKTESKSPRIELIGLIDIVFLLLVFFIYSMLSMVVYRGIPINLPGAETVQSTKARAIYVSIDAMGNIFLNKKLLAGHELLDVLKKQQASFPEKTVIISADRDSHYKVFVDVLDKVRLAGFHRVSIEARPGSDVNHK